MIVCARARSHRLILISYPPPRKQWPFSIYVVYQCFTIIILTIYSKLLLWFLFAIVDINSYTCDQLHAVINHRSVREEKKIERNGPNEKLPPVAFIVWLWSEGSHIFVSWHFFASFVLHTPQSPRLQVRLRTFFLYREREHVRLYFAQSAPCMYTLVQFCESRQIELITKLQSRGNFHVSHKRVVSFNNGRVIKFAKP